jgi:hypothetical protein
VTSIQVLQQYFCTWCVESFSVKDIGVGADLH